MLIWLVTTNSEKDLSFMISSELYLNSHIYFEYCKEYRTLDNFLGHF